MGHLFSLFKQTLMLNDNQPVDVINRQKTIILYIDTILYLFHLSFFIIITIILEHSSFSKRNL